MTLTASVSRFTTTATKKARCFLMYDATGSTLGTGEASEHEVTWKVTSAPEGWSWTTTDP